MVSDESVVNYDLGAIRDARLDIALDDYASFFNLATRKFRYIGSCIFNHIIAKCKLITNNLQIEPSSKKDERYDYHRFFYRNNLCDI